jgi:hypothetical protein
MNGKRPTLEELTWRITHPFEDGEEPFDDDESFEEFKLRTDREVERTLAMSPAEVRAELEALGYDVEAVRRRAREFLGSMGWRPARRRTPGRLLSVAAPIAVIATLAEMFAPEVSLPLAAQAAPDQPPPIATAAASAPDTDDGGSE